MKNPFLTSGYDTPDHFCDRKTETDALIRNIKNQVSTTLFAIRRIGKTGLIRHTFQKIEKQKNIKGIYVDIYPTRNLKEFSYALATAIYNKFPETQSIGKRAINFFRQLRPVITYDPLSGIPELSVETARTFQPEKTIQQLFDFVDQQGIQVVFAIDEFQQITTYPEKNTEAFLRTHIQTLKHTTFIFCGSNQTLMQEIFKGAKRPFYASCSHLSLNHIDSSEYAAFILHHFNSNKRKITPDAIHFILEWTLCHTFYTQFLCNRVFSSGLSNIVIEDVMSICHQLHLEEEGTYFQFRNLLTEFQWTLLQAFALEERVDKFFGKSFSGRYNLGPNSTLDRGIGSLLQKDLIQKEIRDGSSYFSVSDKFFLRWLQRQPQTHK